MNASTLSGRRSWFVVILRDDGTREHRVGPYASQKQAERAERGVTINLDHERFSTDVVEEAE